MLNYNKDCSDNLVVDTSSNDNCFVDTSAILSESSLNPMTQGHPSDINSSHTIARSIIYLTDAPKTLNEMLVRAAFQAPERGITFVSDNGDETWLSFAELLLEAKSFLAGLQEKGIKPGDKLIIQINDKYKFSIAYWGAVLGGIIPAPVASSFAMDPGKNGFEKFTYIWSLLDEPFVVTDYIPKALTNALRDSDSEGAKILEELNAQSITPLLFESFQKNSEDARPYDVEADDIAFLQFTSGSTGNPKGVILKHKNLIANVHSLAEAAELISSDILMNWMPFYHDMGLIGSFLTSILTTSSSYQMSPFAFVKRPQLLLQKISEHKITFTSTPNFGLKRILDKLSDEQLSEYDLSSLRLICNGAEPISVSLTQRFMKKLGKLCDLKSDVMCPVYGMAEACLGVTFAHLGNEIDHISLNRYKLGVGDYVEYVSETENESILFMVEGYPLSGLELRIVDDNDLILNENQIGHIQMKGPNVSQGYYNNSDATHLFHHEDGWVRTGDIGFINDERLTLTGRSKDIIFVNGQNFYAHDLEHEAMELDEVAQIVAGGYQDNQSGLEKIVVFVAPDNRKLRTVSDDRALATQIVLDKVRDKINFLFGFSPDYFVALKAGQILKTTSGKLQRNEMIAEFQKQTYEDTTYTPEQLISIKLTQSKKAPIESNSQVNNKQPQLNQYELQKKIEEMLKEGWSEILQLPISRIGDNDSFFQLGGNSIKAVEMIALAEEYTGCNIPQDIIANYQTISEIANYIVSNNLQLGSKLASIVNPSDEVVHDKQKPNVDDSESNDQHDNDIAIIGMSCRFPGSYNLRRFWETLTEGKNCISEIPEDRWNVEAFFDPTGKEQNKSYSKWGGFLEDIRDFDADFFNISEEEAQQMDPQQRLFLEIAWLALENSGYIEPKDKKVGVYVGAGFNGYMENFINRFDTVDLHASTMTGNLTNMIAARVAHTYNLNGPALTIDTGCSSALVALHLANTSILSGECDMALVGGIQLSLSSAPYIMFSKAGALSHGENCNAFDESSDGFIPGEGAGAIIVKSYKKAVADGDRIFSVIKGSAVNNDGRSLGIMAPNPQGQLSVINEAYKKSGIDPATISYMEAHGTGSEISDLIELRSLSTAFKEANSKTQQCAIGTVKNNIGHLLAASGIASIIKTSLSLYNKKLIPTINFKKEKSSVKFSESPFYVNQNLKDWDTIHDKRRAGVHSFGFGGTNCHLVMEEYEQLEQKPHKPSNVYQVVTISAHHKKAFTKSIEDLKEFLANHQEHDLVDICYSLNAKKSHFNENRAALVSNSIPHLRLLLSEFSLNKRQKELEDKRILVSESVNRLPKKNPVFVFSGELSVYPQMGKMLYDFEPEFRKTINECQNKIGDIVNDSLVEMLTKPASCRTLESAKNNQLLAFVFDYALAQVWIKKGIYPGAVLGYGVGDYVAACISSALSLEDALTLVIARAELLNSKKTSLEYDSVTLQLDCNLETFKVISQKADYQPKVLSLNSHNSITIQCVSNSCEQIITILHQNNISFINIDIYYSFNNINPHKINEFSQLLDGIKFSAPVTPWVSSYMGGFVNSLENTKYYWIEHINSLSSFEHAIEFIADKGFTRYLEIGASNILSKYCHDILERGCWIESTCPSYKKNEDLLNININIEDVKKVPLSNNQDLNGINNEFSSKQQLHMVQVIGKLYTEGLNFDWDECYYADLINDLDIINHNVHELPYDENVPGPELRGKLINIPTYPFQRKETWVQQSSLNNEDFFNSIMKQSGLGRYTITPDIENPIFSRFNNNSSLMPGIGQCELIAHSYKLAYGRMANVLDNLVFQKNWQDDNSFDIAFQQNNKQFFIIPSGESGAQSFFSGNIDTKELPERKTKDIQSIRDNLQHQFTHSQIYEYFERAGVDYGNFYRNINKVYSNTKEVLAEIVISDENKRIITSNLQPGILDSAVQAFIGCHLANKSSNTQFENNAQNNCVFAPIKIDQICMYQPLKDDHYYSHVTRLMDKSDDLIHCNIDICDVSGNVVIEIKNFTAQRIELFEQEVILDDVNSKPTLSLKDYLIYCIADILSIGNSDVDFYAQFMDMNADSVSAIKLVKMLEEGIGIDLYPTLLFEYSSVDSLYDYLVTQIDENIRININSLLSESNNDVVEVENCDNLSVNSSCCLSNPSLEDDCINIADEKNVYQLNSLKDNLNPEKNEIDQTVAMAQDSDLTQKVFEQIALLQENINIQRVEHNEMIDKQMESIRLLVDLAKIDTKNDVNLSFKNTNLRNKEVEISSHLDNNSLSHEFNQESQSLNLESQLDIEAYLVKLCSDKIDLEKNHKIGVETSFLEMGADSIIALNIVKEIEHRIDIDLYPTLLFEYQNIRELSEYLFSEMNTSTV
ncbi:MAG: beta-ketoacyl synthase N-terminal-like domain-containing protein [Gammaproteobacteria bacterium]|nr:beta-ketoacyl synthase N-terminal-like domain-containing protein [Gammaproteobacteria bacterium]